MSGDFQPPFRRLKQAAAGLPEISEASSYGSPSLKVRKKFLCRVKDAGTAALMCPLEEKEMLIAAASDIYFETDHYRAWPAILIRVDTISDEELLHRMIGAFRFQAPKRLVTIFDRGGSQS